MAGKINVFLADDHTVLRDATAELVNNQPDMQVVGQAGTGENTITLVRSIRPDVVVMDIAMPYMNGLEATQRIVDECPETRILVLSAHQDDAHIIALLGAGATSYLPKTASLNELLDAIRSTSRGESYLSHSVASIVVQHLSGKPERENKGLLSNREIEIIRLVALGYTNDRIAHHLHLSKRTVEAHLTHIFNKLKVNSRTEAALFAQQKGWIVLE